MADGIEYLLSYLEGKDADEVRRLLSNIERQRQAETEQAAERQAETERQAQAELRQSYLAELDRLPKNVAYTRQRQDLKRKYRQQGMQDAEPELGVDRIRAAEQAERQARSQALYEQPEQVSSLMQAYQAELARAPKGAAYPDAKRAITKKYRQQGLDI